MKDEFMTKFDGINQMKERHVCHTLLNDKTQGI